MAYELYIIDAISPFFIKHPKTVINWSKVPFDHIEKNGKFKKKRYLQIRKDFDAFITEVSDIGYNAISVDDLCHLAVLEFYQVHLQKKIKKYRKRYKKLFKLAKSSSLKIFLTSDIMFFNDDIRSRVGNDFNQIIQVLSDSVTSIFDNIPDVDGIIFRVGESDGLDVTGDFLSDVIIKRPEQINLVLEKLLPVFEKYNKKLIFRTWTIGMYQVGDLIWNDKTYQKAFGNINSPSLIISMKHGDGDFFRYFELNQQFLNDNQHNKLLEIQTRREYEGFGELPNFVGWEYSRIAQQLKHSKKLIGINVWCQTGGWSNTRNFSFLKRSSFFTELNTFVVLAIFKHGMDVERSIAAYCPDMPQSELIQFLHYADNVTNYLLYITDFAKQKLYFNHVRIPTLFYVFWHYVTLTTPIIELIKWVVDDHDTSVKQAKQAYKDIHHMDNLNRVLKIKYDHSYYHDTFELIRLVREFIFEDKDQAKQLFTEKYHLYKDKYPYAYQFSLRKSNKFNAYCVRLIIPLFFRKQSNYRLIDKVLFNLITSKLYTLFSKVLARQLPEFADNKAMPLENLLR